MSHLLQRCDTSFRRSAFHLQLRPFATEAVTDAAFASQLHRRKLRSFRFFVSCRYHLSASTHFKSSNEGEEKFGSDDNRLEASEMLIRFQKLSCCNVRNVKRVKRVGLNGLSELSVFHRFNGLHGSCRVDTKVSVSCSYRPFQPVY
ncbi:hypothetical protein LXL04_002691 [Taraxacum kok-saghyz]